MAMINIPREFADNVVSGKIRQWIIPKYKKPIKPNERLFIYSGFRTIFIRNLCKEIASNCGLFNSELLPSIWKDKGNYLTASQNVQNIEIDGDVNTAFFHPWTIIIDGDYLSVDKENLLADRLNFADAFHLVYWFQDNHGLPFKGQIVRW